MNRAVRASFVTSLRTAAVILATAILAVALGANAPAALAAEISWSPERPVAGEAVMVSLLEDGGAVPGAPVRVVYQPGSEVERTEPVGATGAGGRIEWTPARGGVVRLEAEIGPADSAGVVPVVSRTLSVRYSDVPWQGLLVMIVAGLVLYGGVIRGFRHLNHQPTGLPPDT